MISEDYLNLTLAFSGVGVVAHSGEVSGREVGKVLSNLDSTFALIRFQ